METETPRAPRARSPKRPAADLSAHAEKRAQRAILLSVIAITGSAASLFFNEAFVAFCGL